MSTSNMDVDTLINGTTSYFCYGVYARDVPEAVGNYLPCTQPTPDNPYVPCCGIGTYCMSNNYCYGNANNTDHTLRYYIAACTDPSYGDTSACSTHCKGQYADTVWWVNGVNEWECCNWDNLTGSDPSNSKCSLPEGSERWNSPVQSLLSTLAYVDGPQPSSYITAYSGMPNAYTTSSASASSASKSSSKSSSSKSSSPTAGATNGTTANETSHGLSSGAKAGIGVGIGLGIPLVLAAIAAFLLMRRRRTRPAELADTRRDAKHAGTTELGSKQRTELDTGSNKHEMGGHDVGNRYEMNAANAKDFRPNELHELPADHGQAELPGTIAAKR